MMYIAYMEVRNAIVVALSLVALALAALLAPGAGSLAQVTAGIGMSFASALLVLAGLSWRWHGTDVTPAGASPASDAVDAPHELPPAPAKHPHPAPAVLAG